AFVGASLMIAVAVIGVAWLIFFGQQVLPNHIIEVAPVEQQRQWSAGRTAHDSIKAWVLHCVGANFVSELPYNLQLIFSGRPSLYVPEELRKKRIKEKSDRSGNECGAVEQFDAQSTTRTWTEGERLLFAAAIHPVVHNFYRTGHHRCCQRQFDRTVWKGRYPAGQMASFPGDLPAGTA